MLIKIRWHRNYTYWKFQVFTVKTLFKSFVSEAFGNENMTTTTKLLCVLICCCSASSVQWLVHHNVCGWFLQVTLNNMSLETCTKQCALQVKTYPQIVLFVNKIQLPFRLKFLVVLNLFLICPQINIADSVHHITSGINMLWPDVCVSG